MVVVGRLCAVYLGYIGWCVWCAWTMGVGINDGVWFGIHGLMFMMLIDYVWCLVNDYVSWTRWLCSWVVCVRVCCYRIIFMVLAICVLVFTDSKYGPCIVNETLVVGH